MFSKNRIYRLIILLIFAFSFSLLAEAPPLSYEEAQKAASAYAGQFFGEVQTGEGVTFVDPDNYPAIYMFPFYTGPGTFPSSESIKSQVATARAYRLQGEALIQQGKDSKNPDLIAEGRQMVETGWQQMRDEENFGTIFLSALHPEHPGVEMYRGLPLNFAALADVQEKAKSAMAGNAVSFKRYLFWGLFEYGAEFSANGKTVLVNLKNFELIDTEKPASGLDLKEQSTPQETENNRQPLYKPMDPGDPEPPFSNMISGVPDYQTEVSKGCAPAASGCAIGYHDHNYELIIDGGSKWYRGFRDPNGEGYLHTIWDELGPAMGFTPGSGTSISNIAGGIEDVCNHLDYDNNYNFSVRERGWNTPANQYSTIKSKVRGRKPMVYTLKYPTYGGGSGYHTVTLIGYGCLNPPWGPNLGNSSNLIQTHHLYKPTENYEYCYICHDNNSSTGTTIYLWWSEFMSNGHLITIRPRSTTLAASIKPEPDVTCENYPNPFNPKTVIRYKISQKTAVTLKIFNITGQEIYAFNEGEREAGTYSVLWNGYEQSGVPAAGGIYYYRLQAGNVAQTGKMTLLK